MTNRRHRRRAEHEGGEMELQEIDVFVAPDGSVSIEVRGIKGPGCLELTKGLEAALGNQITARELRPEAGEAVGEQVAGRQTVSDHG